MPARFMSCGIPLSKGKIRNLVPKKFGYLLNNIKAIYFMINQSLSTNFEAQEQKITAPSVVAAKRPGDPAAWRR